MTGSDGVRLRPVNRDDAPTRVGTTAALAAAGVAIVAVALSGGMAGLPFAVAGVGVLWIGLRSGRRRPIRAGGVFLFAAVLVAGAVGGRSLPLVVGSVAAVVGFDAAADAVDRGEQVGSAAVGGVEATRVAVTAAVAGGAGVVAVALSTGIGAGLPTVVLVTALFGAVLVLIAIR